MKPLPPRMILLLIVTLFVLPLALAWMMFTGSIPYKSENTRNLGQLVIPMVPLDWSGVVTAEGSSATDSLGGFWVILYAMPASCTKPCQDLVTKLRQVHLASGQNLDRIKIALLLRSKPGASMANDLLGIYPRFKLLSHPAQNFSSALGQAGSNSSGKDKDPAIYLVDPLGNIMMTYNGDDGPSKLNKDLTRLLTWSKLDKRS